MQKWEYTFPPTSKEEWIQQVTRDLKGKSIDSLSGEWWPGEPIVPMHHASDSSPGQISLPDSLFTSPPRILESLLLDGQGVEQLNQSMLDALQFGAQDFLIQKSNLEQVATEKLLEGIHLDMINLIIINHPDAFQLFEHIYNINPKHCFLRFQRTETSTDLKTSLEPYKINPGQYDQLQFEYRISSEGNWIEEVTKVFMHILEDQKQWQQIASSNTFFEKCKLKLEAGQDYFKQIVQNRVLHLLCLNLQAAHNVKEVDNGYLGCHIMPMNGESVERYLIRASMSSLAAFLTGVNALCVHHYDSESIPGFFKRIDRNIHHLLHLESGLPSGNDPLAGAYTIDHYTKDWTERIWGKIYQE
jgi:hypothetical protein